MNRALSVLTVLKFGVGMPSGSVRAFVVCLCLIVVSPAVAEMPDRVTLRQESGSRIRLGCYIVDFNGDSIRYRIRDDGPIINHPARFVISVETPQTQPHVNALSEYARGNIDQAWTSFQEALRQETRGWVRRDVQAMLIRCALRRGDYATAGLQFLAIYNSEPKTRHWSLIPLLWTDEPPGDRLHAAAVDWKKRTGGVPQLLAASALLFDREAGTSAEIALRQLTAHSDRTVQALARAQLWRFELQAGRIDDQTLGGWEVDIRLIDEPLRGGPWFVLGEARRRRLQHDRAAQALLWVSVVYDENDHLASWACLRAADSLAAIGRVAEAERLYHEAQTRWPGSAAARAAESATRPSG